MFKLLQHLRVVVEFSLLISGNLLRNKFYPTSSVILSALANDKAKNVTKFVRLIDLDCDIFKLSLVSIFCSNFVI